MIKRRENIVELQWDELEGYLGKQNGLNKPFENIQFAFEILMASLT